MINLKLIITANFLLIFFVLLAGCKDNKNPVNSDSEESLLGIWKISHMSWESQGETGSFTQSQLDSMGLVWTLKFEDDGAVEQITNISGPLLTMPGIWKTSDEQLTLTLAGPTGEPGTILYDYSIDGNILELNWQLPAGNKYRAEFSRQ